MLLNVVSGGDEAEQRGFGDFLDHDKRYERADEFLDVLTKCWEPAAFSYHGNHYQVEKGGLRWPFGAGKTRTGADIEASRPALYFGGASPAAELVAARHADVYLLWGEPPDWVAERVGRMTALAAAQSRSMRFGIRLHVIAREHETDAWAEAERLLSKMAPDQIEIAQRRFARTQSVGQQRMTSLNNGRFDMQSLTVAPNLWSGIGLVRGGAGTALVGSYDQVAARIGEYAALGLDTFILSGYPHLEEAYVVGEEILPRLAGMMAGVPAAPISTTPRG